MAATAPLSDRYKLYALVLLTAVNLSNSVDRIVIGILAEPIRRELHLADWQIGMMTGFAFAVFLGALGLPIAGIADRRSRPAVIVATLSIWSAFTMLCGAAHSFLQLCLCRMGVGVGEAGCSPPAQSLISDYIPRERRATALAFWSMGIPLGSLVGFPIGGLVAGHYGWRAAFVVAGAPGVALALLSALTLKETRPRLEKGMRPARASQPTLRQALAVLITKRSFWLLALGASSAGFAGYGQTAFISSFFLRDHINELGPAAAALGMRAIALTGLIIGLTLGLCGAIGYLAGGWIADKAGARDPANTLIAPVIGMPIALLALVALLLAGPLKIVIPLFVICHLLSGLWFGPVYAVVQGVVPSNLRATSTALLLLITQSIGLGLGPLTVGAVSDFVSTSLRLGTGEGVRWGLICASCALLPASAFFWFGSRTLRKDLVS